MPLPSARRGVLGLVPGEGLTGARFPRDRPHPRGTELEFETAAEAGLDRLVFLLDTGADDVGIPPSALIDREFGDCPATSTPRPSTTWTGSTSPCA
jgi:hypothetical protein